jgi:hypothetical protein
MLSMIWSAIQPANSKSARKKKKQPTTPKVLLSCQLRMVNAQSAQSQVVFAPKQNPAGGQRGLAKSARHGQRGDRGIGDAARTRCRPVSRAEGSRGSLGMPHSRLCGTHDLTFLAGKCGAIAQPVSWASATAEPQEKAPRKRGRTHAWRRWEGHTRRAGRLPPTWLSFGEDAHQRKVSLEPSAAAVIIAGIPIARVATAIARASIMAIPLDSVTAAVSSGT